MSDVAARVAALRAADNSPEGRRPTLDAWAKAVADGDLPAEVLGDVAVHLLETLTDADGSLDMVAARLLLDYGQPRHIEPVQALRPRLRPRAALRDWRLEVSRALDHLVARRDGVCECTVEARHKSGIWASHYQTEVVEDDRCYQTEYRVRCKRCERVYSVTEQHGYHYPIFNWSGGAR